MNPGAICAALEDALRKVFVAGWWDAPPCLYGIYRTGDGAELRALELEGGWPDGPPAGELAAIAADAEATQGASLAGAASPDLTGFAFGAEVVQGGTEQRWIWAVTFDGERYGALKIWGMPGIACGSGGDIPEPVRVALEWLVRSYALTVN